MVPIVIVVLLLVVWVKLRRRKARRIRQETPLAGRDTGTRHVHRLPCKTNRGY